MISRIAITTGLTRLGAAVIVRTVENVYRVRMRMVHATSRLNVNLAEKETVGTVPEPNLKADPAITDLIQMAVVALRSRPVNQREAFAVNAAYSPRG